MKMTIRHGNTRMILPGTLWQDPADGSGLVWILVKSVTNDLFETVRFQEDGTMTKWASGSKEKAVNGLIPCSIGTSILIEQT